MHDQDDDFVGYCSWFIHSTMRCFCRLLTPMPKVVIVVTLPMVYIVQSYQYLHLIFGCHFQQQVFVLLLTEFTTAMLYILSIYGMYSTSLSAMYCIYFRLQTFTHITMFFIRIRRHMSYSSLHVQPYRRSIIHINLASSFISVVHISVSAI